MSLPSPSDDRATTWSRWNLGSLQSRLLLSMVLVLVLALGGLGARTAVESSRRLQLEETARARALARSVALTIVSPLLTQQLDEVEESLLRLALLPGLRELRITDATGRVISQVGAAPGSDPAPRFDLQAPLAVPRESRPVVSEERQPDGSTVLVAWHPVGTEPLVGWVQAIQTLDELSSLQREVVLRTLATAVSAALLGCVGLLWLLRAPLASLRAAAQFARRMDRVDGAQMAVDRRAPHETRALVESLNSTSTRLAEQARTIQQALAEVRQHHDELGQRNHELDAILSISPSGLLALDANGHVCFASAAMGRFTGVDPQALVGQPVHSFERLLRDRCGVPADWPGFEAVFAERGARSGGMPSMTLDKPVRLDLRLDRGRVDTAGIAWLISAQDVTHEREVDRMKSEFLSTAAHELRTPMASIRGFCELLLKRKYDEATQRDLLDTINRQAVRLTNLLNELLDLARIEARRGKDFKYKVQPLKPLVQEVVAGMIFEKDPRKVQVSIECEVPQVNVDHEKLQQALMNVLGNAYKYSPNGGAIELTVLRESGDRGRVGVRVKDHGIGMSPEHAARAFERFFRADTSGNIPGTGLGLSLVKEIIELHGGEVKLQSEAGQGTTVTIWLPVVAQEAEALPA